MINQSRLIEILDLIMAKGYIHQGQKQDVVNRGREQARHILLDKRAELRRLLGRQRVNYRVHRSSWWRPSTSTAPKHPTSWWTKS